MGTHGARDTGRLPRSGRSARTGCRAVSLRVAIDVTTAVTQRAGVGRYTRELVRALVDLPDGPQLCPFFVAPRADLPLDVGLAPVGVQRRIRSWRMEMLLR